MSQENLNFVEVPSYGKHNKILYDGQNYDRTLPMTELTQTPGENTTDV